MVNIGPMGVRMAQRRMVVRVGVRFARRIARRMCVLMMFVVAVAVRMLHWHVVVVMHVALGQVQPRADGHEKTREQDSRAQRRAQKNRRRDGANKGRGAVIGAGTRRSERAECHDE